MTDPQPTFPAPSELPPEQYAWFRQSRTEYGAAALTAQMLHWLVVLGLSPSLLERGARVVTDELLHARLSHELYLVCGGSPRPVPLEPRGLWHADDPKALTAWRAVTAAGQLAVEESVALPVFAARLRNATHPRVREVVEQIHRDEATHRAFAWAALDELTERLGLEPTRAWVRPRLGWWLRVYLLTHPGDDEPVWTDEQLGLGLIDRREHWALMRRCVDEVVLPRFVKRGLLEEGVDADALEAQLELRDGRPIPPWKNA